LFYKYGNSPRILQIINKISMKFILFDVDGTLVHSDRRDSKAFAQSYEDIFGKAFPSINWAHYPQVTDEVIFGTVFQKHFGRKPTQEERLRFLETYVKGIEHNRLQTPDVFCQVPHACRAVQQLLALEGYCVGIATGGWARPAQVKLRHIGIDYQQLYCGYADNNFTREAILQQAMDVANKKHTSIERIVYVGDADWDVKTTRAMQIPFVGIRHRGDAEVLHDLGAKHVLRDYTDFEYFMQVLDEAVVP